MVILLIKTIIVGNVYQLAKLVVPGVIILVRVAMMVNI
jgi:hypothetical protein